KYLLILLILILIFAYINFAPFLQIAMMSLFDKNSDTASVSITERSNENATGKIDSNLIASWDTGCLIPDAYSAYAERHTFVFNTNETANHKRYMGSSCTTMVVDKNEDMTWKILGSGKINLYYTNTGGAIYDIYEITDNKLRFGHGFCNCSYSGGSYGFSNEDRFSRLNDFLLYKKQ
ncbi:lipocalin family protein, partial [Candidatus Roizmanbacteria bacterium]|nr:lipocalin family protein [Candidatus Roizmanbacteria bacterium]